MEVSDSEEALNITGDNLSGDEYAERPAVNAYGSPVNVSRIEPRLAVIRDIPFFIRTPPPKDGKFLHKGGRILNQRSRQKLNPSDFFLQRVPPKL